MIAFSLVYGDRKTVAEIIQIYRDMIPEIFYGRAYFCLCPGRYPIEPLIEKLEQTFVYNPLLNGAHYQDPGGARTVYAGACAAVAVQEGTETEIFDAKHSERATVRIREVLQASCDAPGYFPTPTSINGRNFEDGGMEGKF